MRLKRILIEANIEEDFKSQFNSGQLFPDKKQDSAVWRGTRHNIKTVDKRIPRKDRRPKTTLSQADALIEAYRKEKYPNIPSRRTSIFASPDRLNAADYGEAYMIFVPKEAKVFAFTDRDTIIQTNNIFNSLWDLFSLYKRESENISFSDQDVSKFFQRYDLSDLGVDRRMDKFVDLLGKLNSIESDSETERKWNRTVKWVIRRLDLYFKGWTEVKSTSSWDDEEFMIDTPYYYYVESDWFIKEFSYLKRSWS